MKLSICETEITQELKRSRRREYKTNKAQKNIERWIFQRTKRATAGEIMSNNNATKRTFKKVISSTEAGLG